MDIKIDGATEEGETMSNAVAVIKGNHAKEELIQLVSFNLEREEYGVEVLKVREIIRMTTITQMPSTPHYVEGIINLRGRSEPILRFASVELHLVKMPRARHPWRSCAFAVPESTGALRRDESP
jgi:hypothetical protein